MYEDEGSHKLRKANAATAEFLPMELALRVSHSVGPQKRSWFKNAAMAAPSASQKIQVSVVHVARSVSFGHR